MKTLATALTLLAALAATPSSAQEVSPIRFNQLGFAPAGPKRGILPSASPTPLPWRLLDAQGRVVASGRTVPFGSDRYSGEQVHQIDFTSFTGAGTGFRLEVGDQRSRPFPIAASLYERLPFDALAYFYHNRSGTPIEARFVGERWARPAGHPQERVTCYAGPDQHGNQWPGCSYTLDSAGGWYDAGDHGKYVVNGGIALWTLINAWERQRHLGRPELFRDGTARIPEAGNNVSDLLDEARWEMEWMLSMQVPDGTSMRLPVGQKESGPNLTFTEVDVSGMAHHKLADERWTGLPLAPHQDRERRFLFPPSTGATLNLAATAAQCARVWREIDAAFSARCLAAAERAWRAAVRNPEIHAVGNFNGSGGYGDGEFGDEFFWAAAELFATTGSEDYGRALRASRHFTSPIAGEHGWPQTAPLGTITLAMVPNRLAPAERASVRRHLIAAADSFLADTNRVGYAIPYAPAHYPWGSTSNLLNRAMIIALAHDFTGEQRYAAAVTDTMDYILGRNPLDRSFVTGYGARPMQNPHHRFWAHSMDPAFPPPPPGALSGGPNDSAMADEVARPMRGTCAPQTCWRDDTRAFALNEVAINWNAPLVWVATFLSETEG